MKLLFSLSVCALVLITGCRSPGHKLDPLLMNQIREGTSTRSEVEKVFGQPKKFLNGSNQKILTLHKYQIDRHNPGWVGVAEGNAGSILLRGLTVLYDTNQIVEKFVFHQSSTVVHRERDGILIGGLPTNEGPTRIIKGITSLGEIIQWYGAPTLQTLTVEGDRMLCWGFLRIGGFRAQHRDEEFQVILDEDDFVIDFRTIGSTELRAN